jgi:serpin B
MAIKNLIIVMIMLVAISGIFISGCVPTQPQQPSVNATGATAQGTTNVIDANNQFALDLYLKYKDDPQQKDKNIFFSPYSISSALAMTYEGAKGKTAEEMQKVFYFLENDSERRANFAAIYNKINKANKTYQLNTANALWVQKDYPFLDSYVNTVEQYYGGKATNLDFIGDTENSRVTINNWVEQQTNNKIKDLIPQGQINSMTRLVLTNAVYFKGTWVKQFDKSDTREENFYVTPNNPVKVQMMSRTDKNATFNYTETDKLQILEMPYSGNDTSMLVLLPKENETLDSANLSLENLAAWRNNLTKQRVDVYFPKFKFETKYFMKETLSDMGMPTAFSDAADFSGMTGKKDLFISFVIHQAFVEVDEKGTEAAAATAVIVEVTSAGPQEIPVFRADHPFIFVIQQKDTGNILFFGRVMDPSK